MADTNVSVPLVIHFIFPLFPLNHHACGKRVATVFLYLCIHKGVYIHTHTHTPCAHAYTHKCHGKLVIRKSVTEFPSVLNFCLFSGQSLGSEPLCGFTSTLSISVPGNRLFPSFFSSISFFLFPSFLFFLFFFLSFIPSFFFCVPFFSFYPTYLSTYHRITIFERRLKFFSRCTA